jgi:hypothetical protein
MDDQNFHEVRPDGPVDRLAAVGLTLAILLLAAAVAVLLI